LNNRPVEADYYGTMRLFKPEAQKSVTAQGDAKLKSWELGEQLPERNKIMPTKPGRPEV